MERCECVSGRGFWMSRCISATGGAEHSGVVNRESEWRRLGSGDPPVTSGEEALRYRPLGGNKGMRGKRL